MRRVIRGVGMVGALAALGLSGCLSTLTVGGAPDASVSRPPEREYREGDTPTPTLFDFRFQFPSLTDDEG